MQVFGIKGPSWLSLLPAFDIVNGMSVDYMHCVLLGVTRQLLHLWFDTKNHKEPFYLGHKLYEIDMKLMAIQPPTEVNRLPREIRSSLKFWKGLIQIEKWYLSAYKLYLISLYLV